MQLQRWIILIISGDPPPPCSGSKLTFLGRMQINFAMKDCMTELNVSSNDLGTDPDLSGTLKPSLACHCDKFDLPHLFMYTCNNFDIEHIHFMYKTMYETRLFNPLSTRPHQNVVWYNNSWLGFQKILNYVPKERKKCTAKYEPSFVTVNVMITCSLIN